MIYQIAFGRYHEFSFLAFWLSRSRLSIVMKFPWSKTAEAEKSTSSSDTGVLATPAVPDTTSSTTEHVDPEKRPIHEADPTASQSPQAQLDNKNISEPPTEKNNDEVTRTMSTATQSSAGEPGEDDESKYITGTPFTC